MRVLLGTGGRELAQAQYFHAALRRHGIASKIVLPYVATNGQHKGGGERLLEIVATRWLCRMRLWKGCQPRACLTGYRVHANSGGLWLILDLALCTPTP